MVGMSIFRASEGVLEYSVRYGTTADDGDTSTCVGGGIAETCEVNITIAEDMAGPVYMYYELDNFYQNHRRYVKSRSDAQLRGVEVEFSDLTDCDPLQSVNGEESGEIYYPCGLIANSFFTDRFSVERVADGEDVELISSGIAWESDVEIKFKEPEAGVEKGVLNPGLVDAGYSIDNFTVTDEDFMVWMRVAALPRFRKLHRSIEDGLGAGTYTITIQNGFDVSPFEGSKYVVFSTTSWMGGKNAFLGAAYAVVGFFSFIIGCVFLLKHMVSPRKLGDPNYLVYSR